MRGGNSSAVPPVCGINMRLLFLFLEDHYGPVITLQGAAAASSRTMLFQHLSLSYRVSLVGVHKRTNVFFFFNAISREQIFIRCIWSVRGQRTLSLPSTSCLCCRYGNDRSLTHTLIPAQTHTSDFSISVSVVIPLIILSGPVIMC